MESHRRLVALRSPNDARDWKASRIYRSTNLDVLPKSLDLRSQLPPVRDQGSLGTCVAQTGACMKEWQERRDVDMREYMSPMFIYNLRENQDTEGMYGRDLMKIMTRTGVCREAMFRYQSEGRPPPEAFKEAENFKIKGYARVETVAELKKALYKNGPCFIAFPTYNSGPAFWRPETDDQDHEGGHAVTVIGYNSEGFILRNSWGSFWAKHGYTTYPYEDFGAHWEIWTTVDDNSSVPVDPLPNQKCCVIL